MACNPCLLVALEAPHFAAGGPPSTVHSSARLRNGHFPSISFSPFLFLTLISDSLDIRATRAPSSGVSVRMIILNRWQAVQQRLDWDETQSSGQLISMAGQYAHSERSNSGVLKPE